MKNTNQEKIVYCNMYGMNKRNQIDVLKNYTLKYFKTSVPSLA